MRRNKRKQPQLQEKYPRSDQPQPANGRGGAAAEGRMSGGRSGGPDAGKRVLERGDDFERLPVPKAGRKTVRTAACSCPQLLTRAASKPARLTPALASAALWLLAYGIQTIVFNGVKALRTAQVIGISRLVPTWPLLVQAGGGNEPLLQAGDSSFTSAKSVESFTSARSLPRDTGEIRRHASASLASMPGLPITLSRPLMSSIPAASTALLSLLRVHTWPAGSFAGGASLPASSSGPSADADDTFYDPAGGNDSFLSTRSLGHSSTMSVDSFASAQSADRVSSQCLEPCATKPAAILVQRVAHCKVQVP